MSRLRGHRLALIGRGICSIAGAVLMTQVAWAAQGVRPSTPIDTLDAMEGALAACWRPPSLEQGRAGMRITVKLSFKRDGQLFGKPLITYETRGISDDQRAAYRLALAETLNRCNPLPFTDRFGGVVAGRPVTIMYTDERQLRRI